MILRKPYAFLIKHFKLLHLVLTILLGISIYRLSIISTFLNNYLNNPIVFNRYSVENYIASPDVSELVKSVGTLFPFYVFLIPLLIILITLVILFIMYNKKKPYLLYIVIILYSLLSLAFFSVTYNLIGEMQTTLTDVRFTNIIKDFTNICTITGVIVCAFALVRATGFDIKKFNFVKDLEELDISEEDNEEFEVELNVDSNVIRRKIRKTIRHLKYSYVERRFLINLVLTMTAVIIGFVVYFVIMVHHQSYIQGAIFGSDDFTMRINNVYLTNEDYAGNVITDKYLVVIDLDVKSFYAKGKALDASNCILTIDDKKYRHTPKYRDYIYDIGKVYDDSLIYNKYTNYLLVYEIPASSIDKTMTFRYTMDFDVFAKSIRPKYAKTKLMPINLDKDIVTTQYELFSKASLQDSVMKNIELEIDSYDISSIMSEYYRFCISTKECYDSVEYLTPSIGNIDKTIIKLTGKMENSNTGVYNLYNLIEKFGKIEYKIGDIKKKTNILGKVTSNHSSSDTYYIEVPKDVEKAQDVSLKIFIRNKIYEFILLQSEPTEETIDLADQ